MTILRCVLALLGLLIAGLPAAAQDWPTKPVKIVVPFGPGSTPDVVARLIADHLQKKLGQPFVIDNKGGAGGAIGTETVARAKPDGYTLCMCASTVVSTVSNLRKAPYSAADLDPIAMTTMYISGLMIGPKNPAADFAGFPATPARP